MLSPFVRGIQSIPLFGETLGHLPNIRPALRTTVDAGIGRLPPRRANPSRVELVAVLADRAGMRIVVLLHAGIPDLVVARDSHDDLSASRAAARSVRASQ